MRGATTPTSSSGSGSLDDALLKATLEDTRCQHTALGKSAVAQLTSLLKGIYTYCSIPSREIKNEGMSEYENE